MPVLSEFAHGLEREHRNSLRFEAGQEIETETASSNTASLPAALIAGETLATAKARSFTPATALVRRYGQRKASVEETVLELYHGRLAVAEAAEVAQSLWGASVSLMVAIEAAQQVAARVQAWRARRFSGSHRYVYLQAVEVKQKVKGGGQTTRIAAAVGVSDAGHRHVLAVERLTDPTKAGWRELLAGLRQRGLRGAVLFIGENDPLEAAAVAELFPAARYQGCLVHLEQEVLARVPSPQIPVVWQGFEDIRRSPDAATAQQAAHDFQRALREHDCGEAAGVLERTSAMQLAYFHLPPAHWSRLHDLDPLRRVLREFRETIRLIGPVADPDTLVLLAAARLRWTSWAHWARRPHLEG